MNNKNSIDLVTKDRKGSEETTWNTINVINQLLIVK
jgi:hypothetical protein